jgi:NADH-quinone oxidoreductase subunit C
MTQVPTPDNILPSTSNPGETPNAIKDEVERILGPGALFLQQGKLPAFRLDAAAIHEACRKLRQAGFDYLILVTAVDYPAEKRFEMEYVLSNFSDGREVCLVADVNRDDPQIESVSDIWETADWHEREVYDMFGVKFLNHPDLRRILLDDSWEGHPLRKDYVDKVHDVIKRPY